MQRTLPNCGLEPLVPVGPHRNDIVFCEDTNVYNERCNVYTAVDGTCFEDDAERREHDKDLVRAVLDDHEKWAQDYLESDDYGNDYAYLAMETSHDWPGYIEEYCLENGISCALVPYIAECIDDSDIECQMNRNHYAGYSGDGMCLFSFDVEEHEDQIEVDNNPVLKALHDRDELEGILVELDRKYCFHYSNHWDQDKQQRIFDKIVNNGTFLMYHSVSVVWHYYVSRNIFDERVTQAICAYCRAKDGRRG